MSRPIKFRAWVKSRNIMEYCVDLSPFHVGDCDRSRWTWDEVEVMQYTGLKDRNGKEIFEGDIIKTSLGHTAVVEWDNENGRYLAFTATRRIVYVGREPKVEVIGNRWDNPSLLEGSS